MLFVVIPLAWLTVLTVLLAACRAAAAGDAAVPPQHADAPIGPRLTLSSPSVAHSSRAHSIRRRRLAAHRGARRRVLAS